MPNTPPDIPKPGATKSAAPKRKPRKRREIGGPKGPEPTRYGDWEAGGRCTDFWEGNRAIGDNRALLHRALANYEMGRHRRVLHLPSLVRGQPAGTRNAGTKNAATVFSRSSSLARPARRSACSAAPSAVSFHSQSPSCLLDGLPPAIAASSA